VPKVPRPDIDAQLWLVGRLPERHRDQFGGELLHAVRGQQIFCGYEGHLDVQESLWADWSLLTGGSGADPCPECERLTIRHSEHNGVRLLELYVGRYSKTFPDIERRIMQLAPTPPSGFRFDYRIDVGRAQFEDGIGDFVAVWRFVTPVQERAKKRRALP
jgi:hypothetical protein